MVFFTYNISWRNLYLHSLLHLEEKSSKPFWYFFLTDNKCIFEIEAVVVVILWQLDLQYLCNQWLSPLTLWVWIPLRRSVHDTKLCDMFITDLRQVGFFFGTPVFSTNKIDPYDITEILLEMKEDLSTIILTLHLKFERDRFTWQFQAMLTELTRFPLLNQFLITALSKFICCISSSHVYLAEVQTMHDNVKNI